MKKQETISLDEWTFEHTQFGARHGQKVLTRLINVCSSAIASFQGGIKEQGKALELVGLIAKSVSPDDIDWLNTELANQTRVKGGEKWLPLASQYELVFVGNYSLWAQWLGFCLRVQFSDFLAGLGLNVKTLPGGDKSE